MSDDLESLLAIHLNDHLGAATAGLVLAKRMRGEHDGSELGAFIERLIPEIAQDRDAPVELEGLSLTIEGRRLLLLGLLEVQAERFGAERLRELVERAERQRAEVEDHRRRAARIALA